MAIPVGTERISKVVGYTVEGVDLKKSTPNLPQRIAILAEANTANQGSLSTDPFQFTSAKQVGDRYGYGSPIYMIARILRPVTGGGVVGGIPTVIYPLTEAVGASARVETITVTGTATGNATHNVKIAGRSGLDGGSYQVNVAKDDDPTAIATKIKDAINSVLSSPVSATSALGVVTITTKWAGITANDVTADVETNDKAVGVTYAVAEDTAGSGVPTITAALGKFQNEWNTIVINGLNTDSDTMDELEAFNGKADPVLPTGRYQGIVFKPFIAFCGTTADDPSAIGESRKSEMTIELAVAPGSENLPFEVAAAWAALRARVSQDTPHLDITGLELPDIIPPASIGSMADYENRDVFVKKGCSTVDLVAGKYKVMDSVTTYHPDGEVPPQFRYSRNIVIDWNIRYGYYLLEQSHVVDHALANDGDVVSAQRVVKPKTWKAVLFDMFDDFSLRALIVDPAFSKDNTNVSISSTNPDRFETEFTYKRSGFARIAATQAKAGFNFGE